MTATPSLRVRVRPDVHTRELDSELIVLDLKGGEYFSLDAVGRRIWEELVAGRSPAQVAEVLVQEYRVAHATLLSDVLVLTEQLLARGLLVPAEEPGVTKPGP
jgi:hypothetical protein